MKTIEHTTDLNAAAYYYAKGGKVKITIGENRWVTKYAFSRRVKQRIWKFAIEIDDKYVKSYWSKKATMNVRKYMESRNEIKKKCYEFDTGKHVNSWFHHL